MKDIRTIDEVITELETIIATSRNENDPVGYFAGLYRKVTIKVKEGIEAGFFDDGPRMERLDILFAKKYLEAYHTFREGGTPLASWKKSFDLSRKRWPIVLQHLLMSMNPHINMDLAIAAAEVSGRANIKDLYDDFVKINIILSDLVGDVQKDLTAIWPALRWILKISGRIDDRLIDFSMEKARDGAWKFATLLTRMPQDQWEIAIKQRDEKIVAISSLITRPGILIGLLFAIVRVGERGTVSDRIRHMED